MSFRVLCISSLNFKLNGASQRRQRLLIQGLAAKNSVEVINPQWAWGHDDKFDVRNFPRLSRKLPWRLATLIWLLPSILLRARKADVIVCFDRHFLSMMASTIAKRVYRAKLIHDMVEHPEVVAGSGLRGKFGLNYMYSRFLPSLDGATIISSALEALLREVNSRAKILRVPAIAEIPSENVGESHASDGVTQFLYAGSLIEEKDGVHSLIKAFSQALTVRTDIRLSILGYGSSRQKEAVRQLVTELAVSEFVELKGEVSQALLPRLLSAADVLVLCRPQSLQAAYGFPTKLAEYLSIAKPVIVTKTSDIGDYLVDGRSAYLVEPDDIAAFGAAMLKASAEPVVRKEIGMIGLDVARKYFNAKVSGKMFSDWLDDLAVENDRQQSRNN